MSNPKVHLQTPKAINSELEYRVHNREINNLTKKNQGISPNNEAKFKVAQLQGDGTIMQFDRNFEVKYENMRVKDPELLYDKVLKDISTLPVIPQIKEKLCDQFSLLFKININAVYNYAPASFAELFKDPGLYEYYQLRFFLMVLITYIDKNKEILSPIKDINKYIDWIRPRLDPNFEYLIAGPKANQSYVVKTAREHYSKIVNPSDDSNHLIPYLQLTTQQISSDSLQKLLEFLSTAPNVYTKNPNELCKYLLSIDTAKDTLVTIDKDNNLVFDCSSIQLSDLGDKGTSASVDTLQVDKNPKSEWSNITLRAIRQLFNTYGRIKIKQLVFKENAFISSLTAFSKVFVVFQGVNCDERSLYNTANANYLKIGGHFEHTNLGYEFIQDSDVITYKPARVDVKDFKIYITANPGDINTIVPNQYTLQVSKTQIMQHPFKTNMVYKANDFNETRIEDYKYYEVIKDNDNTNEEFSSNTNPITTEDYKQLKNEVDSIILANDFVGVIGGDNSEHENDENYVPPKVIQYTPGNIQALIGHFNSMVHALDIITSTMELRNFKQKVLNSLKQVFEYYVILLKDPTTDNLTQLTSLLYGYSYQIARTLLNYILKNYLMTFKFNDKQVNKSADLQSICNRLLQIYNTHINDPYLQLTHFTQIIEEELSQVDLQMIEKNELLKIVDKLLNDIMFNKEIEFRELEDHVQCWIEGLNTMYELFEFKSSSGITKLRTVEKTVYIDTTNGTIEGKYFRMVNGKPKFEDDEGNPYTDPDDDFLMYTHVTSENANTSDSTTNGNDILLYNLYKYNGNGQIDPIKEGSFFYSERLSTIQNLQNTITNYANAFNKIRFDNTYIIGDYTIIPDYKNKGDNELHWSDIEDIYKNPVYRYYKVVTTNGINESIDYYAINLKNNTVTMSISPNKVIGIWINDEENDNPELNKGYWQDVLETNNQDPLIQNAEQTLTMSQLFDNQDQEIKQVATRPIYQQNMKTGQETLYETNLNNVLNNDIYYKFYNILETFNFSNEYYVFSSKYDNPVEYNKTVFTQPSASLFIVDVNEIKENQVIYIRDLEIGNFITDHNCYFNGFIKLLINDNYLMNGVVEDKTDGTLYTCTIVAQNNDYTNRNKLNKWTLVNCNICTAITKDEISIIDYFGNTLNIKTDGTGLVSSLLTEGEIITKLDGMSFNVTDSSQNSVIVTYSANQYGVIELVNITTVVRNILTTEENTQLVSICFDSSSNNYMISYDKNVDTLKVEQTPTYIASFGNRTCFYSNEMYVQQDIDKNINLEKSNAYKAFSVQGYDFINNYWTKDTYDYSIQLATFPIKSEYAEVPSATNLELTNDDSTLVYTLDETNNLIHKLNGTYTITTQNILHSSDGEPVDKIYTFIYKLEDYTIDPNSTIIGSYTFANNIEVQLVNDKGEHKFTALIELNDNHTIKSFSLIAYNKFYEQLSVTGNQYYQNGLLIGSYEGLIISDIVFYIGDYKILINYESTDELGTIINDISITETINKFTEYYAKDGKCYQIDLPHLKYSNIPGSEIKTTNDIFVMKFNGIHYKIHPVIAYCENSFVEPKYTNTSNQYITMVNVFNQNTKTMDVKLKNENTLSDQTQYSIGTYIPPSQTHVVESLDDNMLMLSDIDKRVGLFDASISSDYCYIIPTTSRMTISLEFS